MILIDTNLLIDYLKGGNTILSDLLEKEELAICGIIIAELLHGVNSKKEQQLIEDAIEDFELLPIEDTIWHSVGNNLNKLRKNGLNVPFQDAILATLCINNNIKIATNDSHFEKMIPFLTGLQVYK